MENNIEMKDNIEMKNEISDDHDILKTPVLLPETSQKDANEKMTQNMPSMPSLLLDSSQLLQQEGPSRLLQQEGPSRLLRQQDGSFQEGPSRLLQQQDGSFQERASNIPSFPLQPPRDLDPNLSKILNKEPASYLNYHVAPAAALMSAVNAYNSYSVADQLNRQGSTDLQRFHLPVLERKPEKKRHFCNFQGCERTFSTSGHLTRHKKIHTGERAHVWYILHVWYSNFI